MLGALRNDLLCSRCAVEGMAHRLLFLFTQDMDKKTQLIYSALKPKVKALGFNQRELQGIAAKIADNLTTAEDASEEDVNEEIAKAIDAVTPFLSFGQSQANRLLDEWKKKHPDTEDNEDVDEDTDADTAEDTHVRTTKSTVAKKNVRKDDEEPSWFKAFRHEQDARFQAIENDRTNTSRRGRLEALLKDSGMFGQRTLKSFGQMKFDNDEAFDEFLADVETDLKAYNQELADAGLKKTSQPGGGDKPMQKDEPMSDAEIDAMAKLIS